MNIQGIALLRAFGLPGPRKEQITTDPTSIDLAQLYDGAHRGVTLIAFDNTEPLDQNPLLEKNERQYGVGREQYETVAQRLTHQMRKKGVRPHDVVFLIHQTYSSQDISHSGRTGIYRGDGDVGEFVIDGTSGLRKANTDFTPTFIYSCPVFGHRAIRSDARIHKNDVGIPEQLIPRMLRDMLRLPGNPYADFEVYADTGTLFYHDLFLTKTPSDKRPQPF